MWLFRASVQLLNIAYRRFPYSSVIVHVAVKFDWPFITPKSERLVYLCL